KAPLGIQRVDDFDVRLESLLLRRLELGRAGAAGLTLGDEAARLGIAERHRLGDRMISRDRDKAASEDRVRPRRENLDLTNSVERLGKPEAELEAAALADPVLLHHPDLFGPLVEA